MPKNFNKKFTFYLLLLFFLISPFFVFADNPAISGLNNATKDTFVPMTTDGPSLPGIIGIVINITFSILGVIFIGLMIYSGFNWMTASGEEAKVSKAKDTIRRAIIGLIIVAASFSFWKFIQDALFGSN